MKNMMLIVLSILLEIMISGMIYGIFNNIYYGIIGPVLITYLALHVLCLFGIYLKIYHEIANIDLRYLLIKSMAALYACKFTIDLIFSVINHGRPEYSNWLLSIYAFHNACLILAYYCRRRD